MAIKCPMIIIDCSEPDYIKRIDNDRFTTNHIYVADHLTHLGVETLRMSKPSKIGIVLTPAEIPPFSRDGVFHFAYNVTYKVSFGLPKGVSENTVMEKYEPRDPEVKAQYEELMNGGMDEETAAYTAMDKRSMLG